MKIDVYGGYHSPWVQAVLQGLHDREINHSITALPPLNSFLATGVTMPTASIDGGRWQPESTVILREIGCSEVTEEEMNHINSAWRGVLHRADSIGNFWSGFSLSGDRHPDPTIRLLKNFLRSFVTLYFYLLIRAVNILAAPKDPDNFGDQFVYFNDRLKDTGKPYLSGDEPDTLDYLLSGIIQCHSSIYVPPITALQSDPRLDELRAWIARIHERLDNYPYLYSGLYFSPHRPPPEPDSALHRIAFWLGGLSMIALFYLTVPVILILALRRRLSS